MLNNFTRLALCATLAAPLLIQSANAEQTTTAMSEHTANNIEHVTATSNTVFDVNQTAIAAKSFLVPLNINTASELELTALSGIGESKALRIIEWRERNGGFKSTAELAQVNGIGKATVAKLESSITVVEQ